MRPLLACMLVAALLTACGARRFLRRLSKSL
jgi:hypothetical protein